MAKSKNQQIERRFILAAELRADEGTGHLAGYAAVFDSPASICPGFTEVIRRGAFAKTIQEADIRALWNHNPDYVLGRNKSGTLALVEDEHGLKVDIDPPKSQWAQDLRESIRRGDVSQMSFAFEVVKQNWIDASDGTTTRELLEVRLYDVSPVTYAAYGDTEIDVRALNHQHGQAAEEEPVQENHSAEIARRRLELKVKTF